MSKSGIEPKASSTAVKSQDQRYVKNYKYLIIILLLLKISIRLGVRALSLYYEHNKKISYLKGHNSCMFFSLFKNIQLLNCIIHFVSIVFIAARLKILICLVFQIIWTLNISKITSCLGIKIKYHISIYILLRSL